ncbi:membrane protein [Arthrobacter phage EastWest]|uniref:Membrane protein n=1 Tax=Arthrobacter phage EastWest TaxID=2894292 RepID=A0AAE8YK64_9CAUD|nr:membrane protein [Arthrobacter phage EastWest]
MGRYEAKPNRAGATQSEHPWRAATRTFVQVGIPSFLAFAVLVPEIVDVVLVTMGDAAPPKLRVALLAVAGAITLTATIISRIMALPRVVAFTRKYMSWLAPDDKPAEQIVAG